MASYERVLVNGRGYLVCAESRCRRPLVMGYEPVYSVPEIGQPVLPPNQKQSLCGPDYTAQWVLVYPDKSWNAPRLADGYLEGAEPVPKGMREAPKGPPDEFEQWDLAVQRARASNGAETVADAYKLLWLTKPDTEMAAPPEPFLSEPGKDEEEPEEPLAAAG